MSKCNFETECNGEGKCCLECIELCFCNSVCFILDKDKSKIELEKTMGNCEWHEE